MNNMCYSAFFYRVQPLSLREDGDDDEPQQDVGRHDDGIASKGKESEDETGMERIKGEGQA